ncbi:hypothetical protein Scep_003470 [Stephania cephalantha]|uniref:Uncharacterized protein n=1 Tax=Stephania cephalantha TaxID=152367 RepID=A0AAP0PY33_9MAGN
MDLPKKECTVESAKKMASDVVNFLSGRIFPSTTTTTTTATITSTPAGLSKESQHDNTTTQSRSSDVPRLDAPSPKRMHGNEY